MGAVFPRGGPPKFEALDHDPEPPMNMLDDRSDAQASSSSDMGATRMSISLRELDMARLVQIAERHSETKNNAIRRALATQVFVDKTLDARHEIVVAHENGELRKVVWADE